MSATWKRSSVLGVAACVTTVAAIVPFIWYARGTRFTKKIVEIKSKENKGSTKSIIGTMEDKNGNVYGISPSFWNGISRSDCIDIFRNIRPGTAYRVQAYGVESPALGLHPQIIGVVDLTGHACINGQHCPCD